MHERTHHSNAESDLVRDHVERQDAAAAQSPQSGVFYESTSFFLLPLQVAVHFRPEALDGLCVVFGRSHAENVVRSLLLTASACATVVPGTHGFAEEFQDLEHVGGRAPQIRSFIQECMAQSVPSGSMYLSRT